MAGLFWTLVFIAGFIVLLGVRIINQYERGVVFRLGKVRPNVKEPGLRVIIPLEKNSTIIFPSQFMDTVKSVKDFITKEKV